MNTFSQTINGWHDFYIMVGTAAATLVGLLFVGLSLNIELIRRDESADLQMLASLTFNSFVYMLLFAVLFLIPNQDPLGLGLPLLGIGGAGLIRTVSQYRGSRSSRRAWGSGTIARRIVLPLVSLGAVVVIAISVLMGTTDGLYWLVPAMSLLLASASSNAWDFLIGTRRPVRSPDN